MWDLRLMKFMSGIDSWTFLFVNIWDWDLLVISKFEIWGLWLRVVCDLKIWQILKFEI